MAVRAVDVGRDVPPFDPGLVTVVVAREVDAAARRGSRPPRSLPGARTVLDTTRHEQRASLRAAAPPRRPRSRSAATVPRLVRGCAGRQASTRPEAVALATATPDGRPSVRFVLLKSADDDGFVFYSGYESRKGRSWRRTRAPRSASTGTSSAGRCASRGRSIARRAVGVGRVLRVATVRRAALRDGVAAERGRREPAGARGGGRAAAVAVRRGPGAATGDLGRLRARAGRVRVLAAPRRPAPRPVPLPAGGRRLDDRAALAVTRRRAAGADAPRARERRRAHGRRRSTTGSA